MKKMVYPLLISLLTSVGIYPEMLAYQQDGGGVFQGIPEEGAAVAFEGIRLEGGFLISADRDQQTMTIHSEAGGKLRIKKPWDTDISLVTSGGKLRLLDAGIIEIESRSGETIKLSGKR